MLPGVLPSICLASRADRLDRLLAVRAAFLADRDHRGLVEHDALAAHVDQGVGGAEVDRQVAGEVACEGLRTWSGVLRRRLRVERCRGEGMPACTPRCFAAAIAPESTRIIPHIPLRVSTRRAPIFATRRVVSPPIVRSMALDLARRRAASPHLARLDTRRRRGSERCSRKLNGDLRARRADAGGRHDRHRADAPVARAGRGAARCATTSSPKPTSARLPAQRAGGRRRAVPRAEGHRMSDAARTHDRPIAELAARAARAKRSPASSSTQHFLDAHRAAQAAAQRVHHRRRRACARAGARRRRAHRARATRGPLTGMPIAHKDIFVHRRAAHDLRLAMLDELRRALRRARRRAARATPAR